MAEGAQRRIQTAVNDVMDELDKKQIRSIQGDMHRCSARCCDDGSLSMEGIQTCMNSCSSKLMKVQKIVEAEMTHFQERLGRCAQGCQDSIRDKVGPDTKEGELAKFQTQMETCIAKCADDHIALLPSMRKKLEGSVDKIKNS